MQAVAKGGGECVGGAREAPGAPGLACRPPSTRLWLHGGRGRRRSVAGQARGSAPGRDACMPGADIAAPTPLTPIAARRRPRTLSAACCSKAWPSCRAPRARRCQRRRASTSAACTQVGLGLFAWDRRRGGPGPDVGRTACLRVARRGRKRRVGLGVELLGVGASGGAGSAGRRSPVCPWPGLGAGTLEPLLLPPSR